jgi:hypothetical protein
MSLHMYCFLVRCSIPARLKGLTEISNWLATIYNMLRIIPTIAADNDDDDSDDVDDSDDDDDDDDSLIWEVNEEGMNAHFAAIDAKLSMYEN